MAPVSSSPTQPIAIEGHGRRRSSSVSESSDSSASPTTPLAPGAGASMGNPPRIAPISPSTSPTILSYFLGQSSPKSPSSTFPFRRPLAPPVVEDEYPYGQQPVPSKHARRASTNWAGAERFVQGSAPPPPEQHDRAAGMLRRLSLGGALARPQIPPFVGKSTGNGGRVEHGSTPPPNSPATPTTAQAMNGSAPANAQRRPRRAHTISPGSQRQPRAPSPMGERILKGHFDGFN
ncbi:uncharacterized protein LAESUDRAFT_482325 [Laetiporus sulphureus 93-53]|uniref:Uncharacterized protein n=1 Tax=Laetiporus sulphureus 93-53 TaxID=1314785 RepID=A0A165BNY2_9APHY|nr:uncharacterized protein LAESUDRAFT_482325 [Laetiporus sulphureus 93-53]KZT01390.1 hypothetical protein LAESUDRAFT_482325 [Laetiporus sulphureus 93-53]